MKGRTITAFVAVALLAAATTAAAMRSPRTDRITAAAGVASLNDVTTGANKRPTGEYGAVAPRPEPISGARKSVRYEAVRDNWNRYRAAAKPSE